MINNSPTLADVIDIRIFYALADVHTSLPCKVVKYYPERQCVDIQPLLRKEYSNNFVTEFPVISGVPLIFQGSSNTLISFPINPDDIVLAVFSEKSLDRWVNSTGNFVTPSNNTMHDVSDCFAIPGLNTFRTHENPNPDNLEVRFNTNTANECSVKMKPNGNIDIYSPTEINLTAADATITMNGSGIDMDAATINLN